MNYGFATDLKDARPAADARVPAPTLGKPPEGSLLRSIKDVEALARRLGELAKMATFCRQAIVGPFEQTAAEVAMSVPAGTETPLAEWLQHNITMMERHMGLVEIEIEELLKAARP